MGDDEGDEAAARRCAPLVDHPVVVGLDAEVGEFLVLGLGETLPAESDERRRETQRRLGVVDVHVLETGVAVPTALAHLLIGDGENLHLAARESGRRLDAGQGDLKILELPPVALETVLIGFEGEHSTDEVHRALLPQGCRPSVSERLWESIHPHVGRFDHVIVNGDELREGVHGRMVLPFLTPRQKRDRGSDPTPADGAQACGICEIRIPMFQPATTT